MIEYARYTKWFAEPKRLALCCAHSWEKVGQNAANEKQNILGRKMSVGGKLTKTTPAVAKRST